MNKSCYGLLFAGLLVVTGNVLAEEAKADEKKEKSPWKASAELNYIKTTGNTNTQTTGAKLDGVYEVDKWRHTGHAEAFGQTSREKETNVDVTSAERYEVQGKSDYKFTERDYAFGLLKFKRDRFSGFDYEYTASLGYGRKLLKQENMELDVEVGPGMRWFKVDGGEAETEGLLVAAANYWWTITDNSKFIQQFNFDFGETYSDSKSVTGIQANINKTLALKFTYTLRHKSKVPPDTVKTDTETAMTLVYNF